VHERQTSGLNGAPNDLEALKMLDAITSGDRSALRWKSRIAVSRAFGDAWLKTNNLPALRVPTVITPGEWNVLVNPLHPQFSLKWVVTGPDAYAPDAFFNATTPNSRRSRSSL
jgi:RES domain-containing protein